jgi:hypothetical protein
VKARRDDQMSNLGNIFKTGKFCFFQRNLGSCTIKTEIEDCIDINSLGVQRVTQTRQFLKKINFLRKRDLIFYKSFFSAKDSISLSERM